MMIGVDALATYSIVVPWIGFISGSPSNVTFSAFAVRCTVAVCGIDAVTTASFDCCVPATDAFTFSTGLSSGILAKSGGQARLVHVRPRPGRGRRAEPAPRDENVRALVGDVLEDVAGRVLDVEEIRARDLLVVRLAVDDDELRRLRRDVHDGDRLRLQRGLRRLRVGRGASRHRVARSSPPRSPGAPCRGSSSARTAGPRPSTVPPGYRPPSSRRTGGGRSRRTPPSGRSSSC